MKNREGGFTLVELLITLAITGIIFTVAGTAIHQLSTVSEYGNNKLAATHELQNAARWFYQDGQMAVSADCGSDLSFTLSSGQTVTYSLDGRFLNRDDGGNIMTLAQNISSISFSAQGRLISMNITSELSGRMEDSEQATYKVYLRAVQP